MLFSLPDRYDDIAFLGEGAFGSVYRARDLHLDRVVAVKMAKARNDQSAEMRDLVTEARRAAGLHHPNIITVFDLSFHDERMLLTMEYAPGGTLDDRLEALGRLDPDEVAKRICEVASALGHAHEQGVIHRDVKPSNLLIASLDATKVTDFGLAREVDRSMTHLAGTIAYMAPEQCQHGSRLTPAADVFALAVTAYELLTGHRHGGFSSILGEAPPPPVCELLDGIDPAVDDVLGEALELKPPNRTSSVMRFADELSRSLVGHARQPAAPRKPVGSQSWSAPRPETSGRNLHEPGLTVALPPKSGGPGDDAPWFVGVKWSGAASDRDAAKQIWVALVRHGKLVALETGLNRDQAGDFIDVRRQQDDPVLVGMDFGFSLPAWWVDAHHGGSALRLWASMERLKFDGGPDSQWPKRLPPPFWGPNIRRRPDLSPGGRWLRETEERVWGRTGVAPKSVFQLSGAGSVGGQSVRGMAELAVLQDVGWRIWPFDKPGRQTIVEVFPRALWQAHATRQGASSASEARAALAPTICGFLQIADLDLCHAISTNHSAFEAAFTAWALSNAAPALPDLTDDASARREGWIWLPDELPA